MKRVILLSLLVVGCAKAPPHPGTTVSKSGANVLSAFDDTQPQAEETLLKLAATALKAGLPLDAPRAERCWRQETNRPRIRESCALLWAGRGESSTEMEAAILSGRSRMLTLALLQRPQLAARISWPELLERIDSLEKDPHWTRAELAGAWLARGGNPGIAEGEQLLARIRPREGAGPRDIASSLKAIRRLRAGAWQEILSGFCDPGAAGESRLRCWKILGALGPDGVHLAPLLPASHDPDWTLFQRSFPRFAEKLRAFLR